MHVRRIAMLACVLGLLLGGCPAQDTADHRLEVNDHLRAACAGYADDVEIETGLILVDGDRQRGFSKADVLGVMLGYCVDIPLTNCMECSTAIVQQVYGE
jgi:hypothetical protein